MPLICFSSKKNICLLRTHLLVLLPAFERSYNILVESRGEGLRLNDFRRRWGGFEQAIIFMGVAVLAAAR